MITAQGRQPGGMPSQATARVVHAAAVPIKTDGFYSCVCVCVRAAQSPCISDVDDPPGCTPQDCTDVDTPYAGCTAATCTDVDTPYAGCIAQDCTAVDTPYAGCIAQVCTTDASTPYAGCAMALCTDVNTPYAGCIYCAAGKYGTYSAAGAGECIDCVAGKYSGAAQAECFDCNASAVSVSSCDACVGPNLDDCTAATCASGFSNFVAPNGYCCDDFADEPSVVDGSCTSCTGDQPSDCTTATCATGFSNFNVSAGFCCNDMSSAPSVVSYSCNRCTGNAVDNCTDATCASGYHSYQDGTCCVDDVEERTPSGCTCVAGFSSRSGCAPDFSCPAGQACPILPQDGGCNTIVDYIPCGAGEMSSAGGACEKCEDGKVSNVDQSACESCSPGTAPLSDQSSCVDCTGTSFSPFGQVCTECELPLVVSSDRTACTACSPGTEPNENRSACSVCTGNSATMVGSCQTCTAGKIANEQRTLCQDLSLQDWLLTDLAVVADVIGGNSSTNVLVQTELRINVEPSSASSDSEKLARRFKQGLAVALRVTELAFNVIGVSMDGVRRLRRTQVSQAVVTFTIDHANAATILHELIQQLNDPTSTLLTSSDTGIIEHAQVPVFAFVCPPAMIRAVGDPQCTTCPGNQIPNAQQSACTECPESQVPSDEGTHCVCSVGSYSLQDFPAIQCFQLDFLVSQPQQAVSGCYPCALECMNCSTQMVGLQNGYQFLQNEGPVSTSWHAFKCPVPEACPEQELTSHMLGNSATRWMTAKNCTEGHTGVLCASCLPGWKRGPTGTCKKCSATSSGALNPLMLIPVAFTLCYVLVRVFLTFRRNKKLKQNDAAAALFQDLDTNRSGAITAPQLHAALSLFGLGITEERVKDIMTSANPRNSGHIDKDEFVTCEYSTLRRRICLLSMMVS